MLSTLHASRDSAVSCGQPEKEQEVVGQNANKRWTLADRVHVPMHICYITIFIHKTKMRWMIDENATG